MSDPIRDYKEQQIHDLQSMGHNPYPYRFDRTHSSKQVNEDFYEMKNGEVRQEVSLSVCGRVMAIRDHGKSCFFELRDGYGSIQSYIRKNEVGESSFEFFKRFINVGDFLGVDGFPFRSKTGEMSVFVNHFQLLSKSIRTLPEKWHGMKDKEVIYRQRYVDLIANTESFHRFEVRFKTLHLLREFMVERGFIEVDTPMLHYLVGGASAKPFVTHMNAYDIDLYLRIAPELYLKRLVVGGFERVFEMNKNFRNEGVSYKHSPEFTMLEAYQAYADYSDIMELVEEMIAHVVFQIKGTHQLEYQGTMIDFSPPWKRMTMAECIHKHLGIDIINDPEDTLIQKLREHGKVPLIRDKGHMIESLWGLVEDRIIQPTMITEHPISISPLAKKHRAKPGVTERFEPIVFGRELGNAFSELNDPIDQRIRFEAQMQLRDKGDEEAQMMDQDFIRALEYGLPPTGGLGIGIDRLIMFLTNASSIRDVIPFPLVKPDFLYREIDEEADFSNLSE